MMFGQDSGPSCGHDDDHERRPACHARGTQGAAGGI